jgi:hypothetical protein
MDFFGLVDTIRTYCTTNSIAFIYGNDAYINALADPTTYTENKLILLADFNAVPDIQSGTVVAVKYSGILSLGMKTETDDDDVTTISSLEETPIQKWDRRLKYLSTKLATIIGDLSCDNDMSVSGLNFKLDLNKLDLNADFVATPIVFEQ